MATPEQIRKDLDRIAKLYDELGKKNPFQGADPNVIAQSTKETQKLADALTGVESQVSAINQSFKDLQTQLKETTKELFKTKTPAQELEGAFKGSLKEVKKLVQEEEGLTQLTMKDLKSIQEKQKIKKAEAIQASKDILKEGNLLTANGEIIDSFLLARKSLTDEQKTALGLVTGEATVLDDIDSKIQQRIDKEEKVQKNLGLSGGALKAAAGVLDKMGLGALGKALGIEEAAKGMDDFSREIEEAQEGLKEGDEGFLSEGAKKAKVMQKGFELMGESLLKAVTDPLTILVTLGNIMISNNKKITEFERSMVLSASEAKKLAGEFSSTAFSSNDINVTTKNLVKTFSQMSEQFGFIADFSQSTLETATKLEQTVGLSAEAAGSLAAASSLNSGEFEEQYKNALASSFELQRQTGIQFNLKGILEDASKITGTTRANLGGSLEEITKAVTQAKLFGASLEDVASAGKALLDFESSISNELEAELLLGKDLNLERARSAALAGDQITLAKELQEQAGSLADFQKMNVIQQEALAGAMGMTSDQLADILFQQEIQGKTAKELRAIGKDELANRLEQQDAQQSFNAAIEQLKGLLADTLKFLDPIMQGFSYVVNTVVQLKEVFLALSAIQAAFIVRQRVQMALSKGNLVLSSKNVLKSLGGLVLEAARSVARVPFIGPALAVAAGAAIYGAFSKYTKKDDVMFPGAGGSYGNRMISGPEGTFALNNKDTIIAGTNLDQGSSGQASIDNTEARKTNALLQALINKPAPKVQMDSVEVGTVAGMSAFSIQ
jgi:hypothetical protein